jgi:hypothetical protein
VTADTVLSRRSILLGLAPAAAGGDVAGCATAPQAVDSPRPARSGTASTTPWPAARPSPTARAGSGVLLAHFSRADENYHYGGRRHLEVGNTEVLAGIIGRLLRCDVHRIQAADPYPDD